MLLLDIKGVYNYISKNRLLIILSNLALPNLVINLISPILFLIYIRGLFRLLVVKFISYINNITLSTILTSPRKNAKILQLVAKELFQLASENAIAFDPKKSELIHFHTSEAAKLAPLILLDSTMIYLKQIIK
ncbi:hypothetical protein LSUB1_G008534 [Lachnellula subtilissima]|uniref:Reverse transcriptase domain-containing protein n=1 Tax=Lachnellula subtilissima TaxID=602034 RepID=A0A8H8U613_9HELO|nr:hypothetical protein LSUB1_G008534 [Lachnellula subtilissima]